MPGSIKGITIEFNGDTTKLDRSIKEIDKNTKSLDNQLRDVNKALKFNPTSVDLWRQKQQLLTEKIKGTEDKLKLLKQEQKAMDAKSVDKNSEQYRKLQREIIATSSKLKTFKGQLRSIGSVKLQALGAGFKEAGSKIKAAGMAMRQASRYAAVLVGAVGALTVKSAEWADELNTMQKKYHINTKELQLYSAASKLVDVDTETIVKSHTKLTKSMASAADGTKKQTEAFEKLGVQVTNADGSLRDADIVWQETIAALSKVTNETERDALAMTLMGKSAADLNPLIEDGGETYKRVAETMKKYGLDFIDQKTLDDANKFNDELDTMKAIGLLAFQQIGMAMAAYLLPVAQKVTEAFGKFANWLAGLDPKILTLITTIAGIVAVLAPVLIIIGSIASAIGSIISLIGTIGPALAAAGGVIVTVVTGPIGLIIAAIAAVIAIGVLLWKNWDKIKAVAIQVKNAVVKAFNDLVNRVKADFNLLKTIVTVIWNAIKTKVTQVATSVKNAVISAFNGLKARVSAIFNAVKTAITSPIQKAVSLVRAAFNKIKSILSGKISLPHIKLPHFKINGSFSLNPPSVPSIGVDWYKNGAIFTKPTIAGLAEAGPEGIVPLDILWKKLDAIAAAASGDDIANAIGTGLAIQSTGMTMPGTINVVVELDGVKVGQKIVSLYDYTKRAMG